MKKQTLIDHLNEDLKSELSAMIQYTVYAAKATGPERPQLTDFFMAEVPDEQGHASFLANKIVALGGEPAMMPENISNPDDNRGMLQAVLEAEEYGDKGLVVQLEDMIADETSHAEQVERILRDWSK